jgi:hypothetical protein
MSRTLPGILLASFTLALAFPAVVRAAAAWTVETSPTTASLDGVACLGFTGCEAVGGGSGSGLVISSTNGASWSSQATPGSSPLSSVSCVNATNCWASTTGGSVYFYNGTSWASQASFTGVEPQSLAGIWCVDTSDCWTAGTITLLGLLGVSGVVDYGPSSWSAQYTGATLTATLNGVTCVDTSHCWAAGNSGLVLFYGGSSWSAQTQSATTQNLYGISCVSASNCWAVGGSGAVIHWNGTTWASQTSGTSTTLNAVSCVDTTHCWAVGGSGTVIFWNGTSWSSQTSNTTSSLNAVDFINDGFGWAVGAGGTIDAYGCRSGSLSVTPPASVTLPGVTLSGVDQTSTTNATLAVDDETASGSGWNVTQSATQFTTGSRTLPTNALSLTGVSPAAGTGNCTTPTNAVTYPITLGSTAAKIFNAAAGTGGGPENLTLSLKLAIPAKSSTGSYSSTWTFTVASGP